MTKVHIDIAAANKRLEVSKQELTNETVKIH